MKNKRGLTIAGIVIGALLTLAPAFGIFNTVVNMIQVFRRLEESGISDPRMLSDGVGQALYSTAAGLLVFPVGVLILVLSVVYYRRIKAATPPPLPAQPRA